MEKYKKELLIFINICKNKYLTKPHIFAKVSEGIPLEILQNCDYVISSNNTNDVVAADYALNFGARTISVFDNNLFTVDNLSCVHSGRYYRNSHLGFDSSMIMI